MGFLDEFRFLRSLVRNEGAVWFIGAGMSIASGLPSGDKLAREIECRFGLPQTGRPLPDVAQDLKDDPQSAMVELRRYVVQRMTGASPTETHMSLGALTTGPIYTTNYDCLLEETIGAKAYVVARDRDVLYAPPGSRRIYKLHGCIERARDNIVITRDDYEQRWPMSECEMATHLRHDAGEQNIVFVGYGLADSYVRLILQGLTEVMGGKRRRAWSVAPEFTKEDREILEELRIQPLEMSAQAFFRALSTREREIIRPSAVGPGRTELKRPTAVRPNLSPPRFKRDRFVDRRDEVRQVVCAIDAQRAAVVWGQPDIGRRQIVLASLDEALSPADEVLWWETEPGVMGAAQMSGLLEAASSLLEEMDGMAASARRLVLVACIEDEETAHEAVAQLNQIWEISGGRVAWVLVCQCPVKPVPSSADVIAVQQLSDRGARELVRTVYPSIEASVRDRIVTLVGGVPGFLVKVAEHITSVDTDDMDVVSEEIRGILRPAAEGMLPKLLDRNQRDLLSRLAPLVLPFGLHTTDRLWHAKTTERLVSSLLELQLLEKSSNDSFFVPERTRILLPEPTAGERRLLIDELLEEPLIDTYWPVEAMIQAFSLRDGELLFGLLRSWGPLLIDWGLTSAIGHIGRLLSRDAPSWYSQLGSQATMWAAYLAVRAEASHFGSGDFDELKHIIDDADTPSVLHALSRNLAGIWHHSTGDLPEAERDLRLAIAELEELDEEILYQQVTHNLALVLADLGHRSEAKSMLEDVHSEAERLGVPSTAAAALGMLGKLHAEDGELDAGEKALRSAVDQLGRFGSIGHEAMLRYDLGNLLYERGQWAGARRWMLSAVGPLLHQPRTPWLKRVICVATSAALREQGFRESTQAIDDVRKVLSRHEVEVLATFSLLQAGHDLAQEGLRDEADQLIEEAAEEAIGSDDPELCVEVLRDAFELLGPSGSLTIGGHLQKALAMIGDRDPGMAANLGLDLLARSVHRGRGIWLYVFDHVVLRLAREADDPLVAADVYAHVGKLYSDVGDVVLARRRIRRALELHEDASSSSARAAMLHELGNTFVATRQWKRAMDYYEDALELADEVGDEEIRLNIEVCIAEMKARRGDYTASAESNLGILEALPDESSQDAMFVAQNLSIVYAQQGDAARSLCWAKRLLCWAQEAGDVRMSINAMRLMAGAALASDDVEHALTLHDRALNEARAALLVDEQIRCLQQKAEMTWRDGREKETEDHLQEALDLSMEHGNWLLASETTSQVSAVQAHDGDWKQAGYMQMQSMVVGMLAGFRQSDRLAWQGICYEYLEGADSEAATDQFISGVKTAAEEWEGVTFFEDIEKMEQLLIDLAAGIRTTVAPDDPVFPDETNPA